MIGVFTAFTLSQAGMIRYWRRVRGPRWHYRALVNGVGATATGIVSAVVIVTKFAAGAWLVIVAIPLLVLISYGIRRHYRGIERRLSAGAAAVVAAPPPSNTTLLLVESIDEATAEALWFARTTGGGQFPGDPHPACAEPIPESGLAGFDSPTSSPTSRYSIDHSASIRLCSSRCGACRAANRASSPS